jgi:hypothetical protein
MASSPGWPDWANFSLLGCCFFGRFFFKKIMKYPKILGFFFSMEKLSTTCDRNGLGWHFGLLFHKLVWPPCSSQTISTRLLWAQRRKVEIQIANSQNVDIVISLAFHWHFQHWHFQHCVSVAHKSYYIYTYNLNIPSTNWLPDTPPQALGVRHHRFGSVKACLQEKKDFSVYDTSRKASKFGLYDPAGLIRVNRPSS